MEIRCAAFPFRRPRSWAATGARSASPRRASSRRSRATGTWRRWTGITPATNLRSTKATAPRSTASASIFMALAPSIAALFCRFGKWSFRSPDPAALTAAELGPVGERVAARHLRQHGYRVLYRNFRAPHGGEVDIVCRDKRAKNLGFLRGETGRTLDFRQPDETGHSAKREVNPPWALAPA